MNYLGYDETELTRLGAIWTAREIVQQPEVWRDVSANATRSAEVERLLGLKDVRILLTGAGSSAYIGECLAPAITRGTDRRVDAIPTTDLVSGPRRYFQRGVPTLMVSFARSGSSPESVAAVHMADEFVDECYHLVLTCNEEGDLRRLARSMRNAEAVLMPQETHDRSFAMTSSFTSLLLAAARIFGVVDGVAQGQVASHATGARDILDRGLVLARELSGSGFERVIYVGSNELKGLAREGALKLLELTDGRVVASFDSSLGFRHGPKTIINASTLIVLFVSNDPYTRQYDIDLLRELRAEGQAGRIVALFGSPAGAGAADDFVVSGLAGANDIEIALAFAVFAQVLATFHSLRLALTPDNPSVSGTVNRVVRGVTIYEPHH